MEGKGREGEEEEEEEQERDGDDWWWWWWVFITSRLHVTYAGVLFEIWSDADLSPIRSNSI